MTVADAAGARPDPSESGPEPPSPAQLAEAARALRPRLIEEAAETEQRTYYSPGMHETFLAGRFYDIYVPRAYGGLEFDMPSYVRIVTELARGDMGTAWGFGLAANHAVMAAAVFPREIQDALFADGFRAPSTLAPTVIARRVRGGWEIEGIVQYCSGAPWSNHYIGTITVKGAAADGGDALGAFVAPSANFTMLNDWGRTLGLRGSGSHSLQFHGIVPEGYVLPGLDWRDVPVEQGTLGLQLHGNPLYGGRYMTFFAMSIAAATVGAGLAALDVFEEQMRGRLAGYFPPLVPRTQDPTYQQYWGAASTKLMQAELLLEAAAQRWMEYARLNAEGTRPFTRLDDLRLATVPREVMVDVWDIVNDQLFRPIGASIVENGTRFERIFRDLAQATSHRNPQMRETMFRALADVHFRNPGRS